MVVVVLLDGVHKRMRPFKPKQDERMTLCRVRVTAGNEQKGTLRPLQIGSTRFPLSLSPSLDVVVF